MSHMKNEGDEMRPNETTEAKLERCLAMVDELIRQRDRLREVLEFALRESGCDGDLCAHEWHERARTTLAEGEKPKRLCQICSGRGELTLKGGVVKCGRCDGTGREVTT